MSAEQLVETAEIARRLGVSERTVRNWVEREGLPAYKLGSLLRFEVVEVEKWIADNVAPGEDGAS